MLLRVANFGINYLRHFFINFKKFCAYLAANFLNFSKHPQLFTFWWFWRKVWPKIRKLRNQKICQFEPTLKSSLFSGSNFSTFFSSIYPKSTKVKNRPYLTVTRAQKHKENSIQCLSYMLLKFNRCLTGRSKNLIKQKKCTASSAIDDRSLKYNVSILVVPLIHLNRTII